MSNPKPVCKFDRYHDEPMSEQPLTVRVPLSIDEFVRSLPNRTEWLRNAIAAAYEQEQNKA